MVVVAQIGYGARVVLGRSAPAVAAFMLYFCVRLVCDASSRSDVIGYTFGYAEGILFGYGTGLLVRLLLDALGRFGHPVVLWCGAMVLLGMNAWIAIGIEEAARTDGRMHRVFSLIDNETYQVSGALSSVIMIVSWSMVMLAMGLGPSRPGRWGRALTIFCASGVSLVVVRLGQLLGSNSAPVFIGTASLLALATVVGWASGTRPRHARASLATQRGLLRQSVLAAMLALGMGVVAVVALTMAALGGVLDLGQWRFFGFEEQSAVNSSVVSRLGTLERNFAIQSAYAPILGNFFVDRATTGEGTYAHSLIAVLPHLGVLGVLAFLAMATAAAVQLRQQWAAAGDHLRQGRLVLFGTVIVMWSVVFMLLSTFFTNILLWLPLGLFCPGIRLVSCGSRRCTDC